MIEREPAPLSVEFRSQMTAYIPTLKAIADDLESESGLVRFLALSRVEQVCANMDLYRFQYELQLGSELSHGLGGTNGPIDPFQNE